MNAARVSETRIRSRIETAFDAAERRSQYRGAQVRAAILVPIAIWVAVESPVAAVLYYHAIIVVFGLLGFAPVWLRRAGYWQPWQRYVLIAFEMLFLAFAVLVPNPFMDRVLPVGQQLRWNNEIYVFVLIAASVFTYSPSAVLWSGIMAAVAWTLGFLWIAQQPGSYLADVGYDLLDWPMERIVAFLGDPNRLSVVAHGKIALLYVLVAAVLAVAVGRVRDLVRRQALAERGRANLARYFSANMVDELAASDEPLATVRAQDVAVLFADIVGFTRISAQIGPDATIELLRGFHGRMAHEVFAHHGSLDKFLGDGLMATFGTPRPTGRDADNALACARAMVAAAARWSAERRAAGQAALRVVVGIHYGPVVLGDIGGENRLEFAAVGDTVNVASRLEEATRLLGVDIAASEAAVAAARAEAGNAVAGFVEIGRHELRGRPGAIGVWAPTADAT